MKRFFLGAGAFAVFLACGGSSSSDLFGGSSGASSSSSSGSASSSSSSSGGGKRKTVEELLTCSGAGQCELGSRGCCGITCGPEPDLLAIRRGEAESLRQATCAEQGPVACPACAAILDPHLQAFCESGKCNVVDLREHDIASCDSSGSGGGGGCELAWADCCHPCGAADATRLVAVRLGNRPVLSKQLCGGTEACEDCVETFPKGAMAVCKASRCVVEGP